MKQIGIGIVIGAFLLGTAFFTAMPKMMLKERVSPHGHDETVKRIEQAVVDGNWIVSTMNAGLMGRMFGGTIADVMANAVGGETAAFTAFLD
jgi:hypothetical protein